MRELKYRLVMERNPQTISAPLIALDWAKLAAVWMMVAGYLYSRGVLSVGMMLLVALAFYPPLLRRQWHTFRNNRFAWLCIAFFMTYALGGLWTEDTENWLAILRVKLPFLTLPFAMLALPLEKPAARRILFNGILLIMLSGIAYAVYHLLLNPSAFLKGLHFKGPVTGDYIRHTVGLSLSANLALYLLLHKKQLGLRTGELVLAYGSLIAIFIYIHLQAAKSGMLTLYVLVAVFMVYYFYRKASLKRMLMIAAAGVLLLVAAVKIVPPVQFQVERAYKEFQQLGALDADTEKAGGSFLARLVSYDAALALIAEHPIGGVGPGDLQPAMKAKYQLLYPNLTIELIPHNQFLCTAVMLGLPLLLVLLALVISPLLADRQVFTVANTLLLLVSLLVEAMLEVQFGVFVYLFFTLLWMAVFPSGKTVLQGDSGRSPDWGADPKSGRQGRPGLRSQNLRPAQSGLREQGSHFPPTAS